MKRCWFLALKDLRLLLRDPAALFWAFGFPVLFALFFGFAFSGAGRGPGGLRLAVVDEDQSPLAARFIARLGGAADGVTTFPVTRPEALAKVRRSEAAAAVLIGPRFGDTLTGVLAPMEWPPSTSPLELAVDPGRRMEAGFLQGKLLQARFETLADELLEPSRLSRMLDESRRTVSTAAGLSTPTREAYVRMIGSAEELLELGDLLSTRTGRGSAIASLLMVPQTELARSRDNRPDSYFQVAFPQAMLWGLLGCVAAFAVSLVQERTRGTFQRLRIAPLARTEILAGKALACFVTALAVIAILTVVGRLVFQIRLSSYPLLAGVALSLAVCFVGIMMFASMLGRTEQGVSGAGWALFLVMSMFGGGMLPLFIMPPWMQRISDFSPVKWGILALEGVYWRQFSAEEMVRPCAVLIGCGVLFFALGLALTKRMDRRSG